MKRPRPPSRLAGRAPTQEEMDVAALLALSNEARLRPSMRCKHVAEALACSVATVYDLLDKGHLEGFHLGRTRRVFIDSVRSFQDAFRTGPVASQPAPAPRRHNHAAHRAAMARLRAAGL